MIKIYLSIFYIFILMNNSYAQLTLTKNFNEPIIGDHVVFNRCDSTISMNNTSGLNNLWDFTSLITNTSIASTNYTTVAASPSAALYPSATYVEFTGNGYYNYYKSSSTPTTQLELLGTIDPSVSTNFNTNPAVVLVWPVAYGYNKSDAVSGTAAIQTQTANFTGTVNGNINGQAVGTGTIILPGGFTFSTVLQLKIIQTLTINVTLGFLPVGTVYLKSTSYQYYHGSQKFPLLTISYQSASGLYTSASATIRLNNTILSQMNETKISDSDLLLYPNPTKDIFTISLSNSTNENGTITIYNIIGQPVKTIELSNASLFENTISTKDFSSGIYTVKISIGKKSLVRKLIIE